MMNVGGRGGGELGIISGVIFVMGSCPIPMMQIRRYLCYTVDSISSLVFKALGTHKSFNLSLPDGLVPFIS